MTITGHKDGVLAIAFSRDGKRLTSAGADGQVKIWDAATGKELLAFQAHVGPVLSVAFHPDGARVASASADSSIKLWDTTTGRLVMTLREDAGAVNSVLFSPDGHLLISAGGGGLATALMQQGRILGGEVKIRDGTPVPEELEPQQPAPTK